MSKLPETIGYELQSRLDALTVAGMSCFHHGKITLHHDNKQRGRFSANTSGCPPGGTPSHRVPHHIEFNMTSVGEFPKMKKKPRGPQRKVSSVTFNMCEPADNNHTSVPSGIATLTREGNMYRKSWPLGTFGINVVSATSSNGLEIKDVTGFTDPAWNKLEVEILATISVTLDDVEEHAREQSQTGIRSWHGIIIDDKDAEMRRMVEDLLNLEED